MIRTRQKGHVFENTQKLSYLYLRNYLKYYFLFFLFFRSLVTFTAIRFLAIKELKGNILLSS